MAFLKFKQGLSAHLPEYSQDSVGVVYITSDSQEMKVDLPSGRVNISDFVIVENQTALEAIGTYHENLFYYVKADNFLKTCTKSVVDGEVTYTWKTINDLTELTSDITAISGRLLAAESDIDSLEGRATAVETAINTLDATKIETTQDIVVTAPVGNYGKGSVVRIDDIQDIIKNMLSTDIPPSVTQPSASLTLKNANGYEVGYTFTPNYEFNTSDVGTYSDYRNPETGEDVAQATDVTFGSYSVTETGRPDGKAAATKTTKTGSFESFVVTDSTSYKLTSASCVSSDGAIPKSYLGVDDASKQIKETTHTVADSTAVTGYRNCFYGTLTEKSELTSAIIRGLAKSVASPKKGTAFNMDIPVGALRAIIAYPADATTLEELSSVKDANASDAQIASAFTYIGTMDVNGYNNNETYKKSYKIFQKDWSSAVDTKNTYKVIL